MSVVFLKNGSIVKIGKNADMPDIFEDLPVDTYTVERHPQSGEFYLRTIEDFKLPTKIYGTSNNYAERILNTFEARDGSTGVLLSGIKGAGKTLLAKQLSVFGRGQGYPTIVINNSWCGEGFNQFVQSIRTPSIIVFDEFEKVYARQEDQMALLTLLDGVYNSKKLFILTTNSMRGINSFFRNRPGRIFYNFKFETIDLEFVREYCLDNLNDKTKIDEIVRYVQIYSFFNFDMLQAVVEEMNRYGESIHDALKFINIEPEAKVEDSYTVTLKYKDKEVVLDSYFRGFDVNSFRYSFYTDAEDMPRSLQKEKVIRDALIETDHSSSEHDYQELVFEKEQVQGFDPELHEFKYKNGEFVLCLKKNQTYKWNSFDALDM